MKKIIDNIFYFDGCSVVDLAEKYGTPLYIYSENVILSKIGEIKKSFLEKYSNTRAAYAGKAFLTLSMCKILEKEGLCLDVVSGGELYTAIKANFPPEKIEFNGNNKSPEEIEMALDYNIGRFIVDNTYELELLEKKCLEKNKEANILFRITPGVSSDTHKYITTGTKDSKFGIPLDEDVIFPTIKKALDSKYINFLGFHYHVGSQLFDNSSHVGALDAVLQLIKEVKERFDFNVKEFNMGGGFGIKYTEKDNPKSISYFVDPMMDKLTKLSKEINIPRPEVVMEPGRFIVGEAGIQIYTVGSIKEIPNIGTYVSVDGGMTDNIRPGLYQAEYTGFLGNKASEDNNTFVTISGKCCESTDILIKDLEIPKPEPGDIFVVLSTGAYGYSMANNYNKLNIPAVVMVNKGQSDLIVKRQTYDDMIGREIIPSKFK